MGVDILIDGKPKWNSGGYSVTEDATPIDPSDTSGGFGQFTITVPETRDSKMLRGKQVQIIDGAQGTTIGIIRGLGGKGGRPDSDGNLGTDLNITADSRLSQLAADRTAQPFSGTLENAFRYYLGLYSITSGIVVDPSIASRAVVFPGWVGDGWTYLKAMCAAQQVEISLVSNNIVLRPLGTRTAQTYRDSGRDWAIDASQISLSVQVYAYNSVAKTNSLAYPAGGWNSDVQVLSPVDASETQTFNLPISATLSSIQQPSPTDFVDKDYSASSVYSITGGDGLPVLAAQWTAEGGSVTVSVGADMQSVDVKVIASSNTQNAPYTVAMSSGDGNNYSSLRLVGTGVFFNKVLYTFNSGADSSTITDQVGATVDIPFINTYEDAFHAALWALKSWGAARLTLSASSAGINRLGDSGSIVYPTIADFNAIWAGKTVADFNTAYAGKTIADFNADMLALVAVDFENQAFGNVSGAIIANPDNEANFRIRSATITPAGLEFSSDEHTLIADFNAAWAGKTIADFNAVWAGKTLGDFATASLRRTA